MPWPFVRPAALEVLRARGSFEAVDAADGSFDAVCSQDAFLHSGERALVVAEAARVLEASLL